MPARINTLAGHRQGHGKSHALLYVQTDRTKQQTKIQNMKLIPCKNTSTDGATNLVREGSIIRRYNREINRALDPIRFPTVRAAKAFMGAAK